MGALIAGVMVSTFPYTLDVVAKVTSLRDFFVTLFFVGLGMTIPVPTWSIALWMLAVSAFVVVSRMVTVVPVLHSMRLGPPGQLAAGAEPVPDQRALAGAAGAGQGVRGRLGPDHGHRRVRVCLPGGRFDLRDLAQRGDPAEGLAVADPAGPARSQGDEAKTRGARQARADLPARLLLDGEFAARGNPAAQPAPAATTCG